MKTFTTILCLSFFSLFTNSIDGQHLTSTLGSNWTNNQWTNFAQSTFSYNGNNRVLSTSQNWDANSNSWINSYKTNYYYSSSNLKDSALTQSWDNNNSNWINSSKNIYNYNSSDSISSTIGLGWIGNNWLNSSQTINNYTNNFLTSSLYQIWNSTQNNWSNYSRSQFFYSITGHKDSTYTEVWNNNLNTWSSSTQQFYYSDANGMDTTVTLYVWVTDHFELTNLTINTFENSNLIINENYFWNFAQNYWQYSSRNLNSYNSANNKDTTIIQNDPTDVGDWFNSYRTLYFYDNSVEITERPGKNKFPVYPNPASQQIHIPTMLFSGIECFEILTLSGQLLERSNYTSNNIDISQLDNGLYLLRLVDKNGGIQTVSFEKE